MGKLYVLVFVLFAAAAAHGSVFTFTAASPDACAGRPCSASAVFTIVDANDFTITLYNTFSPINDSNQLVTDLVFTLTASDVTMTDSNANYVNIDSSGVPHPAGSGPTGWGFGATTQADNWLLCVVCFDNVKPTAQTTQGILPDQPSYVSMPPMGIPLQGNDTAAPYLANGATFDFQTGATLDTTGATDPFGGVSFSFAPCGNYVLPGTPPPQVPVPEPAGSILVGGGLMGLTLLKRRRTGPGSA